MIGESPREECGVVAINAPGRDISRLAYFALHALQHRGQESAGIAACDGGQVTILRELGLVNDVFDEPALRSLTGDRAIGHVRYSTTGANKWDNAQPVGHTRYDTLIAIGHNGNLTNTDELRDELAAEGTNLTASTDSELIAALLAREPGSLLDAAVAVMQRLVGAYSVVAISDAEVVAFRDAHGVRPLAIGQIKDEGFVVASETCALEQLGATFERDVRPGEAVRILADGVEGRQALPMAASRLCSFESIYFARPDSRLAGRTVWDTRHEMGRQLARESPIEADFVVGLPDSGTPAAIGFAEESGIPFAEAVVRNRYVGRSFIRPDQEMREQGIRLKFNPLRSVIEGKRLVVVDDSIVRGNTTRQTVAMLEDAGAAEIHMRISSPPLMWPCFYGIDMPSREELIAAGRTVDEVRAVIGATTLAYLSMDGLDAALGRPPEGYCRACFTGDYPIPVPEASIKLRFETPVG